MTEKKLKQRLSLIGWGNEREAVFYADSKAIAAHWDEENP